MNFGLGLKSLGDDGASLCNIYFFHKYFLCYVKMKLWSFKHDPINSKNKFKIILFKIFIEKKDCEMKN